MTKCNQLTSLPFKGLYFPCLPSADHEKMFEFVMRLRVAWRS